MCLKTCHFAACFTILWTSISVFYINTTSDVVTVLLIFAKHLSLYLHIFTCLYRSTHTQVHMYNQHTREMETDRHRSLVERGGRKDLLETLHTLVTKMIGCLSIAMSLSICRGVSIDDVKLNLDKRILIGMLRPCCR